MTDAGGSGGREFVERGRYYDELRVGDRFVHTPGRTATEADNTLFTTLTMNTQALHLDAAFAAEQPFGQRLMNSMWTLSTMVGASVTQLTQGTLVAQLGLGDIAFPAPLFHGDTLYTTTEIVEMRESASRPGQGLVTMKHTGRNQDGVVVATATRVALMWRSEQAKTDADAATVARTAADGEAAVAERKAADADAAAAGRTMGDAEAADIARTTTDADS